MPEKDRLWDIAERYGATILYTAPTAIRAFMQWGTEYPQPHDLSSLRLLGSVGEPINPEAWIWYWKYIGGERCPIVDTWWQTETGAILITPLPGVTPLKPGSATDPFPGIQADVVDESGRVRAARRRRLPRAEASVAGDRPDDLRRPRSLRGDVLRQVRPRGLRRGRRCQRDEDGYFWLLGRIDDVMNVAGHRLSTYEIESALVDDHAGGRGGGRVATRTSSRARPSWRS